MNWQYYNPVTIFHSDDLVDTLISQIDNFDQNKIILFCYKHFIETEYFKKLSQAKPNLNVFSEYELNPSLKSCQSSIDYAWKIKPDLIIAIGGGSVIDTAKTVRMSLYTHEKNINNLLKLNPEKFKKPIFIVAPSTHGTGSELTMWATVWDKKNKKKISVSDVGNYPDFAIYNVDLLSTLSLENSIISTLDALSHAFEAIWNKNRNPVSTRLAISAIVIIYNCITKIEKAISKEMRKELILASMYAGLAFSNTKTGAAHSISYPLTLYYNIPHGIACSMSLYSLLKINYPKIKTEIKQILALTGSKNIEIFWHDILLSINEKIGFKLSHYGVKEEELNFLSKQSMAKGRIENNIVDLTPDKIVNILKEIY